MNAQMADAERSPQTLKQLMQLRTVWMQEMQGSAMTALLTGTSVKKVEACLVARRSLLEVLDKHRLESFCSQASHLYPWARVLVLQPHKDAHFVFNKFTNIFLLCPRTVLCGNLQTPCLFFTSITL